MCIRVCPQQSQVFPAVQIIDYTLDNNQYKHITLCNFMVSQMKQKKNNKKNKKLKK